MNGIEKPTTGKNIFFPRFFSEVFKIIDVSFHTTIYIFSLYYVDDKEFICKICKKQDIKFYFYHDHRAWPRRDNRESNDKSK